MEAPILDLALVIFLVVFFFENLLYQQSFFFFLFVSGANIGTSKDYLPDVTSYDYDSPMNEAGDPTEKYFAIRDTIAKYLPPPKIEVPEKYPKMNLPSVRMGLITPLLSNLTKTLSTKPVNSKQPLSFESLNQNSGFVLYETMIPSNIKKNDCQLTVNQLRDHAHILLNGVSIYDLQVSSVNIFITKINFRR